LKRSRVSSHAGCGFRVLTHAAIATATPELGLKGTEIEELHGLLERCGIELIEEIDPASAPGLIIDRAPEKRLGGPAARCSSEPSSPVSTSDNSSRPGHREQDSSASQRALLLSSAMV
jgi:hypothetical protein